MGNKSKIGPRDWFKIFFIGLFALWGGKFLAKSYSNQYMWGDGVSVQPPVNEDRNLEISSEITPDLEAIAQDQWSKVKRGVAEHPDSPRTTALVNAAKSVLNSDFKKQKTEFARQSYALGTLLSTLWMNIRSRPAYCQSLGVDVSPFVDAVNAMNAKEIDRIRSFVENSKVDTDQLWSILKSQQQEVIRMDMADIATLHALADHKAVCIFFNKNA
jgi:hypothetical protein